MSTKPTRKKTSLYSLLVVAPLLLLSFALYRTLYRKPEMVTNGFLQQESIFSEHKQQLWAVQFTNDGAWLASGSVDSTVHIRKINGGNAIQIQKHPAGVTSFQLSPDNKSVVTGSYDGVLRIWSRETGIVAKELKGHRNTVWSVVFSPDGKWIASCGEDKTIRLWNTQTGLPSRTINAHRLNVWKVRFASDGTKIISSSFDQSIKIWNAADGSLLKTLNGHTEAVVGLAVSPDGKLIASGSDDESIKLWDAESGQLLRTMVTESAHVYAVAFSPDGKRLISGSRDKDNAGEIIQNFFGDNADTKGITLRLWEVSSGQLLETAADHANDVMDVCFSPDGKRIASGSTDKTLRLWKVLK